MGSTMKGMQIATKIYNIIGKIGLNKLKSHKKIWSLMSVCNFWIFFRKDIGKRFGVSITYTKKGFIKISFKEGFSLTFSENPGLPDIYALYGYIKHYTPKSGDIVVDAGGYHGLCALFFSKLVGNTGKVIVFEPDIKNMKVLEKNMQLNNITNIICIRKGLWSHADTMSFLQTGEMFSMLGDKSVYSPGAKSEMLEVVNLIETTDALGYKNINFVKMDIEGAEVEVIKGLKEVLQNRDIHFAIASYHMVPNEQYNTSIILEKEFAQIGYKVVTGRPEHLTTYAWK